MKKILLVGGTGLIGAQVLETLSSVYEVFSFGRNESSEIRGDLANTESFAELNLKGFYAVIHCAGVTDEDLKYRPAEAFVRSSVGMNALIQKAVSGKVKRFTYISTSHVYGKQEGKIDEDSVANPLSDYALAHYTAEQTLRRNSEKFENTFVLRPNAVFGEPRLIDKFDRWNLIPYSFPLEAVYSKKIVLRSSGEQNRNFVGTKDIAVCIETLLSISVDDQCLVINPIGKESMSVIQFAETCAEIFQRISDMDCAVERPEPSDTIAEAAFEYGSKFDLPAVKVDLQGSLTTLITRVFEDFKNGKRYQA